MSLGSILRKALLLALTVAPLVPLSERVRAEDPDFESVHRAALAGYLVRLDALAIWSAEQQLFQERDRVWRCMLEINPENAAARKGLRYSKGPDGAWKEPAPRDSKNRNPAALAELPKHRATALEPFKTAVLAEMQKSAVEPAQKKRVFTEILFGDPDDETVRALLGELKLGDAWVLIETASAKQRRAEIKVCATSALGTVPNPRHGIPNALEMRAKLTTPHVFETETVRVFGTGDAAEAERTARLCQAVAPFLRAALNSETEARAGWTVYLLADARQVDALLGVLPGVPPTLRDTAHKINGTVVPDQPIVLSWDADVNHRIDVACRQTVSDFLSRSYDLKLEQGWAWEGLGLYLTHELAGTRLTFFSPADANPKQAQVRKRLLAPESKWLDEALTFLQSEPRPSLKKLLESDVHAMHIEDELYAYAFAAYLLEGRPAEAPEILRRIGYGKETTGFAIQTMLHQSLAETEERLVRWLAEMR